MGIVARYALCIGAAALLAGCGGLQAPGAMPQSRAVATHAERGGSWMLPEATSDDLLYVANFGNYHTFVKVYTYPSGKLVGKLYFTDPGPLYGLCVDRAQNIFVVNSWDEDIFEYAHGGTKPIATLTDNGQPSGCSIDPTTGDLAVTNTCDGPVGSCFPSGTTLI